MLFKSIRVNRILVVCDCGLCLCNPHQRAETLEDTNSLKGEQERSGISQGFIV